MFLHSIGLSSKRNENAIWSVKTFMFAMRNSTEMQAQYTFQHVLLFYDFLVILFFLMNANFYYLYSNIILDLIHNNKDTYLTWVVLWNSELLEQQPADVFTKIPVLHELGACAAVGVPKKGLIYTKHTTFIHNKCNTRQ